MPPSIEHHDGNGGAIRERLAQHDRELQRVDRKAQTPWATLIAAFVGLLAIASEFGQLSQRSLEQSVTRNQEDIQDLKKDVVPRGEHAEKWRSNDQHFTQIEGDIDDIKKQMGSTYTLKDAFGDVIRRLDKLEMEKK